MTTGLPSSWRCSRRCFRRARTNRPRAALAVGGYCALGQRHGDRSARTMTIGEQDLESERHVRLDRVRPLDPAGGQPLCDEEGELERLVAVQARVAKCLVPTHQIGFDKVVATTNALSHVVAGQLHMHSARPAAELLVNVEETVELGHHIGERPSLVTVARLESIAVHGITDPGHLPAAGSNL